MTDKIKKYQVGYTQVPNCVLCDPNISERAKGIYAYLFSKPDGWQFHPGVIAKELQCSHKVFKIIVTELVGAGYMTAHQYNENGRFGGMLYEFPDPDRDTILPSARNGRHALQGTTHISNTDVTSNTDGLLESIGNTPIYPLADSDLDTAVENFVDGWNSQLCEYCPHIAKIAVFNQARRSKIKARLAETRKYMKLHNETKDLLEYFLRDIIYDRYVHSQFLRGEVPGRNGAAAFKMGIDHVIRPEFFAKMVEYRYDDRPEYRQ